MREYRRVLFVGEDNLCETIMAEAIMKKIAKDRGIEIEIMSKGLVVLFPEPVNPKAVQILDDNQLKAAKQYSEELKESHLTEDTIVFTMTESQAEKIKTCYPEHGEIHSLRAFAGYEGDVKKPVGEMEIYQQAFENIDLLVKVIAQMLFASIISNEKEKEVLEEEHAQVVSEKVQKIFEETVDEIMDLDTSDAAIKAATTVAAMSEKEKQVHEKNLEEEYLKIVEKAQAREAAKNAEKEPSEYKVLYQEILEKNRQEITGEEEQLLPAFEDKTAEENDTDEMLSEEELAEAERIAREEGFLSPLSGGWELEGDDWPENPVGKGADVVGLKETEEEGVWVIDEDED